MGMGRREAELGTRKWLWAGLSVALLMYAVGVQHAQAEPLTPLTPAENQYLEQIRRVFAASHDPVAFNSDGELLNDGRFACESRARGFVGQAATFLSPVVTQVAFVYLCPN